MTKNLPQILLALFVFFKINSLESHMLHQEIIENDWKEENLLPFNELMISWNAERPVNGKYLFYVSVKTSEWSPWLMYATWGREGQTSFQNNAADAPVRVYQDAVEVLDGGKATGFQIRVVQEGDAPLNGVRNLHVYTNGDKTQDPHQSTSYSSTVSLPVKGISQMALNHLRKADLCSPTSTTAVVRFLSQNEEIDPIAFAQNAWDSGFNIFGNWVFNVAEAAAKLGPKWSCWVERLGGFDDIYQHLQMGTPVIVSVRGPLPGSAKPYIGGHLIAVIGYDSDEQKVICMDPAFPTDDQTHVLYDLSDFIQAWSRRGRVAYVFSHKTP